MLPMTYFLGPISTIVSAMLL